MKLLWTRRSYRPTRFMTTVFFRYTQHNPHRLPSKRKNDQLFNYTDLSDRFNEVWFEKKTTFEKVKKIFFIKINGTGAVHTSVDTMAKLHELRKVLFPYPND